MLLETLLSFLAVAALAFAQAAGSNSTYPIINTKDGPVQGTGSPYRDNVTVYRGIPYAAPPTGSLRWKAPSAAEPWNTTFSATTFAPQCAQPYSSAGIFSNGLNSTSEDCLYLNIWTPTYSTEELSSLSEKKLPVYFWIFGGRFEGGSGDVKTYDGSGLAIKDIIVVTINYRLGSFGFLAHPDLSAESGHNASGNYGIQDQQFALQWVADNIAAFGGNPDQITVGGQSAGSASSLDMMWSPLSRDLIAGVISESGARGPKDPNTGGLATSYRTKDTAEAQGVSFLETLNVTSIAELREVPIETLIGYGNEADDSVYTDDNYLSAIMSNPPLWRPVVDGYVLTHTYGEALRSGDHGDVPILTGGNKDEGDISVSTMSSYNSTYSTLFQNFSSAFFAAYPAYNDTQVADVSDELGRDMSRIGTWQWSTAWAAGGAKSNVYVYYWTHAPPIGMDDVYHGSELWYVFNNIPYTDYEANITWTEDDLQIEATMSQYWANFIRTGDPNGGELTYWAPSVAANQSIMWLGDSWGSNYLSQTTARFDFISSWFKVLHEW
jgi:carboxylesterase 2